MIGDIQGRIFVVGCPRSGTTLLQSLIAVHPDVASFPESKFFVRLVYPQSYRTKLGLTKIGIAAHSARHNLEEFVADIGVEKAELAKFLSPNAIFMKQYARAFTKVVDLATIRQNKQFWLEKTPEHIDRIEYIEKFVSQPKFVHIIRKGTDVVASLYEVTHKYPKSWMGSAWSIDKCIACWLKSVNISQHYLQTSNHLIVMYDDIIENAEIVVKRVYKFLNLSFEEKFLENREIDCQSLIRTREEWKQSVKGGIVNQHGIKFHKLFTDEQKHYIRSQVNNFDLNQFRLNGQQCILKAKKN